MLAPPVSLVLKRSMILDTFPSAEEFYKKYWGKKPFIVRGFIPEAVIDSLVDGDTLAGLALEDDIKSRIISNNAAGNDWVCDHGPFDDDRFDDIGDKNWSLLVQNVEQYHTDTAELFKYFQFSPRWLIDDIMVSFSAPGGSVGPHTDSYHTFLVQGIGRRAWKISAERIDDDRYADNPDMKVLQHGFEGETFEVTAGDVIYMPPFFEHEGRTLEAAMTFSVGFLGPKLSEMLGEYAQYLDANEHLNTRYLGEDLSSDSAAFSIAQTTQDTIKGDIISSIHSDSFSRWMAAYFSTPTHDDTESTNENDEPLSSEELLEALQNGAALYRPEHIKLTVTTSANSGLYLAIYGETISLSADQAALINPLNTGQDITLDHLKAAQDQTEIITLITALYNKNVLSLRTEA
jgi:50S ribosomal protein L16 3-hydroxylase